MESFKDTKTPENLDHCLDHINKKGLNTLGIGIYNQPRWFVDIMQKQRY